ncbi:MAG: nucleotide sugar dehydrogenase [Candidatus Levybacteria bacterium]|nr:nucleotide sugar dehydrogenase [Candidatus Levybacteria bacterium]
MIKNKNVAVIGIGRVGLPLALVFANEGFTVYGVGRSKEKISSLKDGKMPFIEKNADNLLKKHVNKNFIPTIEYKEISKCNYIILTLGTPIDENMNPVFDQIISALKNASPYLRKGQTLILRSTVSPKTTEYVQSFLNDLPGITVGKNFYLAFCPERISEGYSIEETKTIPQIIGGVDKVSAKKAKELFVAIGVEPLITDAVSAELAKLFTNMYRYINFAIANEFMIIADNYYRDIYEITNLVNHKYERGGLKLPGLTGGPCLFKDGFFLISDLPFTDLISTSWKINESIPLMLVKKIRERIKLEGKKVAILGLSFKSEIDDMRESLSFKVRKAMLRERANVFLHDPFAKDYVNQEIEKDVYKVIEMADLIFVATNHKQYKSLDINKIKKLANKKCVVCDVWNVFGTDKIVFTVNQLSNRK